MVFNKIISKEKLQGLIASRWERFTSLETQHCDFHKTIKSTDCFSNKNLFRHSIVINSIHHTSLINSENRLSSLNVKYNLHK